MVDSNEKKTFMNVILNGVCVTNLPYELFCDKKRKRQNKEAKCLYQW